MITEKDICAVCKIPTTTHHTGYIGIIDPEKSEIAKRMEIKIPGQYAMKVR